METVKEKLVKLILEEQYESGCICDGCESSYISREVVKLSADTLADYMIEHGVTIATDTNVGDKWVSVDERLPEDGSSVFVMLTHTYESDYVTYGIARYIDTSNGERHWCEDHHGYLEWDKYSDGRGGCSSYKVTRWMPIPVIPQPPKGE